MILVAFRHGLRSSELVDLRWDQIDFAHAVLHVRRAKKGTPATHPVVWRVLVVSSETRDRSIRKMPSVADL
jgi:integrase